MFFCVAGNAAGDERHQKKIDHAHGNYKAIKSAAVQV
jgi:hypothetical protein